MTVSPAELEGRLQQQEAGLRVPQMLIADLATQLPDARLGMLRANLEGLIKAGETAHRIAAVPLGVELGVIQLAQSAREMLASMDQSTTSSAPLSRRIKPKDKP